MNFLVILVPLLFLNCPNVVRKNQIYLFDILRDRSSMTVLYFYPICEKATPIFVMYQSTLKAANVLLQPTLQPESNKVFRMSYCSQSNVKSEQTCLHHTCLHHRLENNFNFNSWTVQILISLIQVLQTRKIEDRKK